jgi:Sec-independent protein translocase protein TatA
MWGPAKIPEFAKALGRAKGEFNKASQEFTAAATAETNAAPVKFLLTLLKHQPLKLKMQYLLKQPRN